MSVPGAKRLAAASSQGTSHNRAGNWRTAHARIFETGLFDHDWYAAEYPCTWDSGVPPLEHFVKYGAALGRKHSASPTPAEAEIVRRILEDPEAAEPLAPDPDAPLVSVICITYNQARYVEQTLDSILAQRTSFSFEVLVGDDCSSDETAAIIASYAERHPQIVPVLRKANLGPNRNFVDLAARVRGRFVAICEGDDFWIDNSKLQKQIDFFAENPEFTVCFHKAKVLYEDHPEIEEFFPERCKPELNLQHLARENCIQTNSVMYRWRFGPKHPFELAPKIVPGDWYTHLLQAKVGRIGYLDECMSVYRRHSKGMWSPHTSELARSRLYGNGEIEFFRSLKAQFGGAIADHFDKNQRFLFRRLAVAFLEDSDVESLHALIGANQDISAEVMEELGFDPETAVRPDAAALRKSIVKQSRISVIVTSYNHKEYIERCLDSILGQEGLLDLQIIVGDDNSPDGTADIIQRYADANPDKITFIRREKNAGMLQNMKDCLARADGDYIAFCEGDDYWLSSRKLMKQLAAVRPDRDIQMCFNWLLLELSATGAFVPHAEQGGLADGEVSFFTLARRPLTANFSCCFYRAEAISAVPESYFTGTSSADWLFNLYVADRGKVVFLKELLSVYRIQSRGQWSGLSQSVQQARTRDFKREFAQIFGQGRGFEDVKVRQKSRTDSDSLPAGVIAAVLDWPPREDWFELIDGSITLRGWVLSPGRESAVVITSGHVSRRVPLDIRRPDVIKSMLLEAHPDAAEITCGFSCNVPFQSGLAVGIDIETEGSRRPWIQLQFEEQFADEPV